MTLLCLEVRGKIGCIRSNGWVLIFGWPEIVPIPMSLHPGGRCYRCISGHDSKDDCTELIEALHHKLHLGHVATITRSVSTSLCVIVTARTSYCRLEVTLNPSLPGPSTWLGRRRFADWAY